VNPSQELSRQGLKPLDWEGVLQAARARLSPEDAKAFARLHRNFTAYVSEETLTRFYAFVFSRGLQLDINGFRYRRLENILTALFSLPGRQSARVLEVGAGAGILSEAVRSQLSPLLHVTQDICAQAREHLAARGFAVLPYPAPAAPPEGPFDLILCADSLGELNSDDDGLLAKPDSASLPDFGDMLEDRYGFVQKVGTWKPYLAPSGRLLIWEPFTHLAVWKGLAGLFEADWNTRLDETVPGGEYLELSLP
jgi:hypothetical protein